MLWFSLLCSMVLAIVERVSVSHVSGGGVGDDGVGGIIVRL